MIPMPPPIPPDWYYKIEVSPGVWTPGSDWPSVALTRWLLAHVDVAGQRVLDIGTMEGMIPELVTRRNGYACGWDRCGHHAVQVAWLQEMLGNAWSYQHGGTLRELWARYHRTFDVVVFGGVLYHTFDPLGGLLSARQMVRDGGLLLLETAAINRHGFSCEFNAGGRYYPEPSHGDYWFPTIPLVYYWLRFARLEPVANVYLSQHGDLLRLAVLARAVDQIPVDDGHESWLAAHQHLDQPGFADVRANFGEYVWFARCRAGEAEPVPVASPLQNVDPRELVPIDRAWLEAHTSLGLEQIE